MSCFDRSSILVEIIYTAMSCDKLVKRLCHVLETKTIFQASSIILIFLPLKSVDTVFLMLFEHLFVAWHELHLAQGAEEIEIQLSFVEHIVHVSKFLLDYLWQLSNLDLDLLHLIPYKFEIRREIFLEKLKAFNMTHLIKHVSMVTDNHLSLPYSCFIISMALSYRD